MGSFDSRECSICCNNEPGESSHGFIKYVSHVLSRVQPSSTCNGGHMDESSTFQSCPPGDGGATHTYSFERLCSKDIWRGCVPFWDFLFTRTYHVAMFGLTRRDAMAGQTRCLLFYMYMPGLEDKSIHLKDLLLL